jgi:hypothetical protein
VLEPTPYAASELADPVRAYAMSQGALLTMAAARGRPNACFVLKEAPRARSLIGLVPVGFTIWTPGDSVGDVRVKLAQTADAGYVANLSIRAGRVRGNGHAWGPDPAGSPDVIIGHRVGLPDRSVCIAAAERAAGAEEAFRSVFAAMRPVAVTAAREGIASRAGTYRIEVCPGSCTAGRGRAALGGLLVMEDSSYSFATVPEPVRRLVTRESSWQVLAWSGRMNACFVPTSAAAVATLGGGLPVGFTRWLPVDTAGTVGVWLFQTGSQGYAARFAIDGDTLRGTGRAVTRLPFDDPRPPDAVRGVRVGPPDRSLCVRAGERAVLHGWSDAR